MTPAVFLDRDGTIIRDRGYLDGTTGVELLPSSGVALSDLSAAGFLLVVVTNQSGIGRGLLAPALVRAQHDRLRELLRPFGAELAAIEVCPHRPTDGCACRKPRPLMLLRSASALGIDIGASFMVGDKPSDVGAGRAAGCGTVHLGRDCPQADYQCSDLGAAARWIVAGRAGIRRDQS